MKAYFDKFKCLCQLVFPYKSQALKEHDGAKNDGDIIYVKALVLKENTQFM